MRSAIQMRRYSSRNVLQRRVADKAIAESPRAAKDAAKRRRGPRKMIACCPDWYCLCPAWYRLCADWYREGLLALFGTG